MFCNICPRKCNIDRGSGKGFCGMGENPVVARAFLHMWEEPCISGTNGSGTVFFSGCNLKCIFCQNHEISHGGRGKEISAEELAGIFLSLRDKGAHNINLVTPAHFAPSIKEAIRLARAGRDDGGDTGGGDIGGPEKRTDFPPRKESAAVPLDIPIVYNTNGYESLETLQMFDGTIDVYLPDLKYISAEVSMEYSGAKDYFDIASRAIREMFRQVGNAQLDENGLIKRGVIIRHLVLPGHISETLRVLDWIAENFPKDIYISLMSQYTPCHLACEHPVIGRRLTRHEYEKAIGKFAKLGFNGYVQERESASTQYIPDFNQVQF